VLVLVAVQAGAATRAPVGGRVVASLPSAPASLDPLEARSAAEVTLSDLLFDPLYRLGPGGAPLPALALALPVPAAGKDVRIALRAGVRFHDGRPVRPADVAASLRRALPRLAIVTAVASTDDAVVLTLRRPLAPVELAVVLSAPQLSVTPLGRPPGKAPVGSGPFKLRKLEARRVELDAFAEHFAGRPYLDALVLRWFEDADEEARAYEAGEADASLHGAVAFAGHEPKYPTVAQEGPATVLSFLGFGAAHPVTRDVQFRRGVSLALGRAALRHVGSGEKVLPSDSPVSPDLGGAALAETAANLTAARAALTGARGLPLELLVDRTRPDDLDVAARVVAALDQAGVTVAFTPLGPAELARRVAAGQCDLWLGQLVPPAPTALAALAAAFDAGGDDWLATHLAQSPLNANEVLGLFLVRMPIVPLAHRALRVQHKKALRGLAFGPLGLPTWADAYLWTGPDEAPAP
jgi:peptide/nickel transport system substrate-binding protein